MERIEAQTRELRRSAPSAVSDQPLRRDVRMLGFELGQVLKRYGSAGLFDLVERIRDLSKRRRAGEPGVEDQLREHLSGLPNTRIEELIRALACFFDLANLAEDRHRIRVLRHRERAMHPAARPESVGAALDALREQGFSAEQVRGLLDRLDIELVFTAHPTEAKRRTVRQTLRRLHDDLIDLERGDLLPRERERLLGRLQANLDCLWETEMLRPRRPTVLGEVRRSLFVVESLWEVVPRLYRTLRQTLERDWPGERFDVRRFIRFGTWIGGDRDGNPNVTWRVTRDTLGMLRRAALDRHREQCRALMPMLSISERYHRVSDELRGALERARERWPELRAELERLHPFEKYRHWLVVIAHRLDRTAEAAPDRERPEGAYDSAEELAADVRLIAESLRANGHRALADGEVRDWLDRIDVFGFHLARLDIREDAGRFQGAADELMRRLGVADDYAERDEAERQALLTGPIPAERAAGLDLASLDDEARETADLFVLLERVGASGGAAALGTMIASMTHHPSDILAMMWLGRFAAARVGADEPVRLPAVPLFETIEDLRRADAILDGLLRIPAYAAHVRATGGRQVCMIGYSDSTKDGGYLPANWQLYEAQRRLAEVGRRHGVGVVFFHGRGGALGRGGGPAARGILSLPPDSVHGSIRSTEQGEILAERYDEPEIAHRHLEQVTWATMLVSARPGEPMPGPWRQRMEAAAGAAFEKYRRLIEDEGFLAYFDEATPIASIETLPIGSRPSRRRGRRSLGDLRAIPYTFAWTQNRHLLTAFFGLGTGLHAAAADGWPVFREMYEGWPFFRAVIDNAELALAKCDMGIAGSYAELLDDSGAGRRIFEAIREEHARSCEAVLAITGRESMLDGTPWLQRSITVRNPYIDPLNFIQVELMRRRRRLGEGGGDEAGEPALAELLRLSVQGIAAGMRTTG